MSKKNAKKNTDRKKKNNATSDPPDRRAMEKITADVGKLLSEQEFESIEEANEFLQKIVDSGMPFDSFLGAATSTPVEQAQQVMYEAWDASGAKRVNLARKALSISEDCADAYVLLAEESAKSLKEARNLYQAGVEAGERALGEEGFEDYEGAFWGFVETRPYTRARLGLATCLWQLGHHQEAIEHYQEMLRLNPEDNQGVRDLLLPSLMEKGMEKETEELLDIYSEDWAAMWLYSRALFLFRTKKTRKQATGQLREALEYNPHVPDYLLGRRRMPQQLPYYVGFGDRNEAVSYVAAAGHLWAREKGALEWLREVSDEVS